MTNLQPEDAPCGAVSLATLAQRFPSAFGSVVRPLKIGIHADLYDEFGGGVSEARVRELLGAFTRNRAYLEAVAQGGQRVDLAGQPAGEVSEFHRQDARGNLVALERKAPEAKGARSALLKAYDASGLSRRQFATQQGVDFDRLNADIDRARHERALRHARRVALVASYQASSCSVEEFAAKKGLSPKVLLDAIAKVGKQDPDATTPSSAAASISRKPGVPPSKQRRRAERAAKFNGRAAEVQIPDSTVGAATNSNFSDHQVPYQADQSHPSA